MSTTLQELLYFIVVPETKNIYKWIMQKNVTIIFYINLFSLLYTFLYFCSMNEFELVSSYQPTGDQPEAIAQLTQGILDGTPAQTLLGVTGSGKTFTVANVIRNVQKPTLILSHNKTLAAQLYTEFKNFFPNNAVEYYVSYYDYYQPEAYIASTDTYIEKDLQINQEIDRMRLAATSSLLSGRKDVIVVSSVSCIYGMGNPGAFYESVIELKVKQKMERNKLLRNLVACQYVRNDLEQIPGNFRVKGDTVDVCLAYSKDIIRITFWDDEIDCIEEINGQTQERMTSFEDYKIYPANLFMTSKDTVNSAIEQILKDLSIQEATFRSEGKLIEANRLHERVTYDVEMIKELGHCSGIENYSRYFDGREPGTRPYCLLDFFPDDFLMVIDESHVSVPQIGAMYGGDRSRKKALVEYGFRLPAAMDNRPLKFEEFQQMIKQIIYVSATPAEYELQQSGGVVVEQVIRPTGLLDPEIIVRPSINQIDDLLEEIQKCIELNERILVTTLTKRMAEDLTSFLMKNGIRANYIHSDVDTLDRVRILEDLRAGKFDVLVGVNLLREGLDLPEVSLVAILDADKEGFLRSHRSLTQTAGRAARNVHGKVIMYGQKITQSMKQTINETQRRREKQMKYNLDHHITPRQIVKTIGNHSLASSNGTYKAAIYTATENQEGVNTAAEPTTPFNARLSFKGETVESLRQKMELAAKGFDFILAAQYRDEMLKLQKIQQN
jgi:excinuclease ABC subunit B